MSEADSDVTAENIDADPQSTEVFRPPNSRPAIKLSVRLIETYKHINKVEMPLPSPQELIYNRKQF